MADPAGASIAVDGAGAGRDRSLDPTIIVASVALLFALVAFALGLAARHLPAAVPRLARIVACASVMPLAFTAVGLIFFVDGNVAEWIASREPRAYRNMGLLWAAGLAGAWFALRRRTQRIDPATFD